MKVNIACKSCHRRYAVEDTTLGKKVRCQQCGTTFLAEVSAPAAARAANPAAKPPPGPRPSPAPGKPAARPAPRQPASEPEIETFDELDLLDDAPAAPPMPPPAPLNPAPAFTKGWAQLQPSGGPVAGYAVAAPVVIEAPRSRIRGAHVSQLQMAISRILLVIYLCAMAGVIVKVVQVASDETKVGPIASTILPKVVIAMFVSRALLFMAITGTLFFLAEKLAAALMRFETADYGFLRGLGIAGLVEAGLLGMVVLNPDTHGERYLIIGVLVIASGLLLWFTYGLKPLEAVATAGLSSIGFVLGWFAVGWLSLLIALSGIVPLKAKENGITATIDAERVQKNSPIVLFPPEKRQKQEEDDPLHHRGPSWDPPDYAGGPRSGPRPGPRSNAANPNVPTTPPAKQLPIMQIRAGYSALQRSVREGSISREAAEPKVAEAVKAAQAEKERIVAADPSIDASNWSIIERDLQAMQEQAKALPSEKPDPSIFQTPSATGAFAPDATAARWLSYRETTVGHFRLRLPVFWKPGSTSGQAAADGSRSWDWTVKDAQLTVRVIPASNPQQKQPLVVQREFMREGAKSQKLFTVEAVGGQSSMKTALLAGLPMTRIEYSNSGSREAWVEYVARDGNDWISLRARTGAGGSESMSQIEDAIKTLHDEKAPPVSLARPGTNDSPAGPPLSGTEVAEFIQLESDARTALLRFGPRVEGGLIECLENSQSEVRSVAAELLPQVATSASVQKLQPLMSSRHKEVAAAVKATLQRIAPGEFDEISLALKELKGDDVFKRRDVLKTLAGMTPVEARRDEVNTVLESLVLDPQNRFNIGENASEALATWATAKTANKIIPLLNNPKLDSWMRPRLIKAVSGLHDNKTAAAAVMKWVILAPDEVVKSLTQMGPVAEDETIRIFNANFGNKNRDGQVVRNACLRILSEIGTNKSLDVLTRASRDQRDPVSQALALSAIDAVKTRLPAATQPAKAQ